MRRKRRDLQNSPLRETTRVTWRRNITRFYRSWKWLFFCLACLANYALGVWGFHLYYVRTPSPSPVPFTTIAYDSLELFVIHGAELYGLHIPWQLEFARFFAPVLSAYAAIQALIVIFREQFHLARARFVKNHIVICGLDNKGLLLCEDFLRNGYRVVIVERNRDSEKVARCKELGAIAIIGSATDDEVLAKARVHRAAHLIAVCGDDGTNAEVKTRAGRLVARSGAGPLSCFIHIGDVRLCDLLNEHKSRLEDGGYLHVAFFNVYDSAARILQSAFAVGEDRTPTDKKTSIPQVAVIGFSAISERFLFYLAKQWKGARPTNRSRMKVIVFYAPTDGQRFKYFVDSSPLLRSVLSIEGKEMEIESLEFGKTIKRVLKGAPDTRVYVCSDDDSLAFSAALSIYQNLREIGLHHTQIIVVMNHDKGLSGLVKEGDHHLYENIIPFGHYEQTCSTKILYLGAYEQLAMALHEEYRREERILGYSEKTNQSIVPWESLQEHLKDSNRKEAADIGLKLMVVHCDFRREARPRPFAFTPDEVEKLAIREHQRWKTEKEDSGWRRGPRDNEKKVNPNLVDWDLLPEEVKNTNRKIIEKIPEQMSKLGFEIYRRET